MRFVWQAISRKLDGVTRWLDDPWFESATFEEKMENEEVPEGVIVLENLNFWREEWGFEKPDDVKEPTVIHEESEEEEPDFKSMSAKEKKEWEAKQKEKAEAKAGAEAAAQEGEAGEGEEEEKEPEINY